ncbi:MAG: glycosyltransferase family 2 protein [Deltaproteobacteria bacterium]|nr:glycosyltransferase family 2 protein [Deltaproteobacteria bacterium]
MNLSVVIPSFQTPTYILSRCIDSVLNQIQSEDIVEIIVVDSSSKNLDSELLKYKDRVKFSFPNRRMFAGEARNLGASQATNQWIAFLDSDCIWNADWMKTAQILTKKYPNWIAFNGGVHFEDLKFSWAFALHLMEFHEFLSSQNQSLRFLHSGNLLIRRSFFKQVGGFRSDWLACEDIGFLKTIEDLPNLRSEIRYIPELSITHTAHLIKKENILEKARFMGYWRGFYDGDLPKEFKITPKKRFKIFGKFLGLAFFSAILSRSIKLKSFYLKEILFNFFKIFQLNLIWAKEFKRGFRDSKNRALNAPNHPDIS